MPLLTGDGLLDKGGYLFKFKYRDTVMKFFKNNGYKTYLNHYYPLINPSQVFNGLTEKKYGGFFAFDQLWSYRLSWYAPIFEKGNLTDNEKNMIVEFIEDNFEFSLKQLNQWVNDDGEMRILKQYSIINNPQDCIDQIQKEYNVFKNDRIAYTEAILTQQLNHPFFKLPSPTVNKKVTEEQIQWFKDQYKHTFDRIYELNKKRNLKNMKFPFNRFMKHVVSKELYEAKQIVAMYKNAIYDSDLFERVGDQYPDFKAAVSMRRFIDDGLEWIDSNESEEPFMMYLHVDDAHSPEIFFSIEENRKEVLNQEFEAINHYLDSLKANYYGNLASDLSLVYCDLCLKHLFESLDERGMLENTIIAITADHGFSYSYRPIRTVYVNNEHYENYNIPFVLYGKDIGSREEKEMFHSSMDIVPTLIDAAGLMIPEGMRGKSMLSEVGREYATVEYMGGGCPDMLRRKMILGVRTNNYFVVIKINVLEEFGDYELDQVYDLAKDPDEFVNLSKNIDVNKISYEIDLIHQRFDEIKKDFKESKNAFN